MRPISRSKSCVKRAVEARKVVCMRSRSPVLTCPSQRYCNVAKSASSATSAAATSSTKEGARVVKRIGTSGNVAQRAGGGLHARRRFYILNKLFASS